MSFSADGGRVVSGSWDKTVRVWDAVSGECVLGPLEGHTDEVSSVSISADGRRVVSGSWDKTVRVWDAVSGECVLGPLEGHTDEVTLVSFSAGGRRVVSGSRDDTVHACGMPCRGNACWGRWRGTRLVSSVSISLLTAGVWCPGRMARRCACAGCRVGGMRVGAAGGAHGWVNSVSISADGRRVVSGSDDKTVRVWDAVSGECVLGPLEGHTNWVSSVSFSADGRRVVSGSWTGRCACGMPCRGNACWGRWRGTREGDSVSFSADGRACGVRVVGQDGARVGCRVGGMRVGAAGGAHGLGDFGVVFC